MADIDFGAADDALVSPTGLAALAASALGEDPDEWDPIAMQEAVQRILVEHPGRIMHTGMSPHSGHKIDTFRRCPTLYAYKYVLDVLRSSSSATDPHEDRLPIIRGTLGHQGLALHYQRKRVRAKAEDPDVWATPEDGIRRVAWESGPAWAAEADLMVRNVRDYIRHYWSEQYPVLGVEHVLDFSQLYGRDLTRSADYLTPGAFWDHKWVGRKTKQTVERYILDGQFLDYRIAAQALWGRRDPSNPRCRNQGVWLNLCEIETTPGHTSSARRFERIEIPPAPHAVRRRIRNLRRAWEELDRLKDVDPWEWPAADNEHVCLSYGMCEGLELCRFGPAALRA